MYEASKPNALVSIAAPTLDLKMQSRKARVTSLSPIRLRYELGFRSLSVTDSLTGWSQRAMLLAGPPFVISNNRVARRMARLTDYRPSLPFVNRREGHEHNWRLPVPRHHSTRALPWTTLWQMTSAFFLAQEYKDVAFISSQQGRHTSLGCKEGTKSYEYDLADSGAAWGWSGLIAVGWSIPFTLYSNVVAASRRAQAVQAVPGQPPLITVLLSKHNSTMTTGGGGKQRVNGCWFSYGFTRMFELISAVEISWSMSCYIISDLQSLDQVLHRMRLCQTCDVPQPLVEDITYEAFRDPKFRRDVGKTDIEPYITLKCIWYICTARRPLQEVVPSLTFIGYRRSGRSIKDFECC
ncbi:hypothetical protein EDD18DRAFT_1104565 [Armillaria luteobubalina]|uniref:Uncharacterized protein n=1 Tax=Armillaria luteobubalina TaxID=153913 RepID=A0AA39Q8X3_9AGAR|nr:hypothetical protein EDD18DRAFT_1104565 [Armillaria luteobubalina]